MARPIRTRLLALSVAAAALAAAPTARAGLLPVSFSMAPDTGGYRYTYGVILTTDAYIKPGDYFTIYDFAGFVPGSMSTASGWTTSVAAVTLGTKTVPTDNPALPNLTWTYNGPQINGQKGLGNFSAVSTENNFQYNSFTAQTHRVVDGHVDNNITDVQIPVPGAKTPEPASLALMGIGLPLVSALKLLRRRRNK
jgi:hypothetical protein